MAGLENWRPIKDTHAIQTAQLLVQFGQPAGDVLLSRVDVLAAAKAAAAGLKDRQPLTAGPLPFPFALPAGVQIETMNTGFVYTRRMEGGAIAEQFSVSRDSFTYDQFLYTRWAPFRERASLLMSEGIEQFATVSTLSAVSSAYVDVFEFVGTSVPNTTEVVDINSPFVTSASVRSSALWHTHSGSFDYPDAATRRLVQINIDVLPGPTAGKANSIRIGSQITDQFGQPESTPLAADEVNWGFIAQHAEQQHLELKALLAKVLTPAAAQAISLT